jgi:putative transposase
VASLDDEGHRLRRGVPEDGALAKRPRRATGRERNDPSFRHGQYTSIRFTETLTHDELLPSIGSVGDAFDNAYAKTVMGLYKNEAIAKGSQFRVGPLKTLKDVEEITFSWVQWYNAERLHSYLGNIPPEEYEADYYAKSNVPSTDGAANMTAA